MKIIHLNAGGDMGGARTHMLSLLSSMMGRVEHVTLVSMRNGDFAADAARIGIDTVTVPTRNPIKLIFSLKKIIKLGGYDIIHCHGAKANVVGIMLGALTGLPVVTTVHSDPKKDYLGNLRKQLVNGLLNRWAIRCTDYRIAVSRPFSKVLLDRGYDPEKLFILPNCLLFPDAEPASFRADEQKRRQYLAQYGLEYNEGDVIVGIAARFDPVKDIPMLLRAFSHALEKAPNMRLLLGGDGEQKEKDALKSLVASLGLEKHAAFTGWIGDMPLFLSVVDINTISSISEGLPFSILEGIRYGCASVSTRVGGIIDIIDHGVNGFLADPHDDMAFGDSLAELATNNDKRLRFRDLLYIKCRREYSIDAMVAKQINIYETILRRESRPRKFRDGAMLCGAYGNHNVGDNAIMESLVSGLRSLDPDLPVTVLTRTPKETRRNVGVRTIFTFNMLRLLPSLLRTRLFISGGGTLIQDQTSTRSIIYYLCTIMAARMMGANVMLYGCGIGPVSRRLNRWIAGHVLNKPSNTITLREKRSMEVLGSLGVTRPSITLTADPAFALRPAESNAVDAAFMANGMASDGNYIGFAVRSWDGYDRHIDSIAAAAAYAFNTYGLTPVFYPMSIPGDITASRKVMEKLSCPAYLFDGHHEPQLTIGILSRLKAMVSMRLHALIFAVSVGVPVVGLSYDAAKVAGFMEYLGHGLFCELSTLKQETLTDLIDKALKTDMTADAERLRLLERQNLSIAAPLLSVKKRGADS